MRSFAHSRDDTFLSEVVEHISHIFAGIQPMLITQGHRREVDFGAIHKWRQQRGGGRGVPKFWCSKGGCVILVLQIGPKCWQGGEGVKNPKNLADVICERPLS